MASGERRDGAMNPFSYTRADGRRRRPCGEVAATTAAKFIAGGTNLST